MKPAKPATAILCGLIRNAGMASLQISQIMKFRGMDLIDRVIFSTWPGELDRYPEVKDAAIKMGATIIESCEPDLGSPGHVLHQSKALSLALAACDDDEMVLKLRPDVMILNDAYRPILSGEAAADHVARRTPTLFSHPVWVGSGMLFYPFYFNDIVYFGAKTDLMRLADIDLKAEIYYAGMMPEQFFHLAPVLPRHAQLRAFARLQSALFAGDQSRNAAYARALLQSPFWHRTWALSIRILLDNYMVGFEPANSAFAEATLQRFAGYRLEDLVNASPGLPGLEYYPVAAATQFSSASWAAAAEEDRFVRDGASAMLREGFATLDAAPELDNPIHPDPDALRLAQQLEALFADYRPKICLSPAGDQFRTIREAPSRLTHAAPGDLLRDLSEQVNHLRRENEELLVALGRRKN